MGVFQEVLFGSWINTKLDSGDFSLYFGILMVIIFHSCFIDRNKLVKNKPFQETKHTRYFELDGETYQYNVSYIPAFILSFIVGVLSGLIRYRWWDD